MTRRSIKTTILLLMIAALLLTALAEEVTWRGSELQATWLTTEHDDINIPNLRPDGTIVMIRLEPADGTIAYDVINGHASDDMILRTARGENVVVSNLLFHRLITPEGGGFPTVDPEQDNFDMLFFLEDESDMALAGAQLVIRDGDAEQNIPVDGISREKPD